MYYSLQRHESNSLQGTIKMCAHLFACTWHFGLLKGDFRNTQVDCQDDIAESVRDSSQAGVNVPKHIGKRCVDKAVTHKHIWASLTKLGMLAVVDTCWDRMSEKIQSCRTTVSPQRNCKGCCHASH